MAQTVIVGLSGSAASMRALQWAGARATGDEGQLVCVTVDNRVPPQLLYTGMPTLPFADSSIGIAADAIVALSSCVGVAAARTLPATAHVSVTGEVELSGAVSVPIAVTPPRAIAPTFGSEFMSRTR